MSGQNFINQCETDKKKKEVCNLCLISIAKLTKNNSIIYRKNLLL